MSSIVTSGKRVPYGCVGGGVERAGAGGARAAAEHVGADHEVAVGVDGLARPDHDIPPAGLLGAVLADAGGHVRVAGERVADQDGVGAALVERAERLVRDVDVLEPAA